MIAETNSNLESFLAGYIGAAIWSSVTEPASDDPDGTLYITAESELAAETLVSMRADCQAFINRYGNLIAGEPYPTCSIDRWTKAGHDFWLTRCCHGAGFWDGAWPENGDALTAACGFNTDFPPAELYVGDDGLVYSDLA